MKLLLLLFALVLVGCSPSAYRVHASAIVTVAGVHTVAGGGLDTARAAALDAVEAEYPDVGPDRTAALRTEAARWEPAGAALDAVRSALRTWVSSVELARSVDDDGGLLEALLPMAARVLSLYSDAARLMRSLGVEAPQLPPAVLAIVGAS
jgi:hypothetical protein